MPPVLPLPPVVNQNPTDLHLSNAFVEENLQVGTHVGIFTTTDPDDLNNTRPYTYQLIIDPSKALPLSNWIPMVPDHQCHT